MLQRRIGARRPVRAQNEATFDMAPGGWPAASWRRAWNLQ